MEWGEIEAHYEVRDWLLSLDDHSFGVALRHIDRLAEYGATLDQPYTRQLRGKLRELRFDLGRRAVRMSYFILPGRRIVLLTVFRKTRGQERREIDRAERAMLDCLAEGHTPDEDEED
jgi:hypothetical protein